MRKKLKDALNFIKNDFKKLKETSKKGIWQTDSESDLVFLLGNKLIDFSDNFDDFTEVEKTFYLCKIFDDEVQSSGDFYSLYTSENGKYVYDVVNCFKIIGSKETSEIIDKVNNLFDKKLPSDFNERDEYIDSVYDDIEEEMDELYDEYSEYSDNIENLLYEYAIKNKDQFKNIK